MLGQQQSITKLPPHGAGTNSHQAAKSFTFTTSASAEQPVIIPLSGGFVTWYTDAACHIRFGREGQVGSAAATDIILPANQFIDWWHREYEDAYYTVLGISSGGVLRHWRSQG